MISDCIALQQLLSISSTSHESMCELERQLNEKPEFEYVLVESIYPSKKIYISSSFAVERSLLMYIHTETMLEISISFGR